MKKLAGITLVTLVVISFNVSMYAQEAEWEKLNKQSQELYQQGKYSEAARVAEEALKVAESIYGPNHPNIAKCLIQLSIIYEEQGRHAEAEDFELRSYLVRKDPTVLNAIAESYREEGKYSEAEQLFKRALEVEEQEYGHLFVESLNGLAKVYEDQDRYAEAEDLYKRVSALEQEWSKGAEHELKFVILGIVFVLLVIFSGTILYFLSADEDIKYFTEYAESMGLSYRSRVPDGVSGFPKFRQLFNAVDYFDHVIYGKTDSFSIAIFTCVYPMKTISYPGGIVGGDRNHELALLIQTDQFSLTSISEDHLPFFHVWSSDDSLLASRKMGSVAPGPTDYESLLERISQVLQLSM